MSISDVIDDIKSLKIQGANAVAVAAIKAIEEVIQSNQVKDRESLKSVIDDAVALLAVSRPTEPCMRNALLFVQSAKGQNIDSYKRSSLEHCKIALENINKANIVIAGIGARKIKDGMTIYTHCHSSTVIGILKLAWSQGRRFVVCNTETRPLYQGRKTAQELAAIGIPVVHHVDSAMRFAIKSADLVLIGCDAITAEGHVINKVGSALVADVAHRFDIPVYSCSHSWKFDPKTVYGYDEPIEMRSENEVWLDVPKGIVIKNYAFEDINPAIIAGVITELGIFRPERLFEEMTRKNKWMF